MKKLQLNKIYNNFKLIEKKVSKEIDSIFYTFKHEKLGTELVYVQNTDKEKAFTVSFKTPSPDSKGYQHILEHSVLRSSKKYNFGNKETFAEVLKKSMPTFLNAVTYPDKTIYPFSTMLESEFFKIMDIYIDAVLHPLLLENENFFRQEGWRWDKDEKGKYFINGVVFNEMKGRLASPEVLAEKNILAEMFPDNEYQHEAGGDPDVISDLKYEDLVKYHQKYYHPTNATFYIYGDVNIFKVLEKIENDFLQNFTKAKKAEKTEIQKKFKKPKAVKYFIPAASTEKSSFLNVACMGESAKKVNENFTLSLLNSIIFNQNSSVYKNIVNSGLVSNVTSFYERDVFQNYFTILFSGINTKDVKKIENLLDQSLLELVKNGVDEKLVDEVLNNLEYSIEKQKYGTAKGLDIIKGIMSMTNHDLEFYEVFEYRKKINYFKNVIKNGGLEKLIQKYFIKNTHKVLLVLEAKKDFEPYKKLENKIKKINNIQDKKVLDKIDAGILAFKKYQNKENPDNIDTLILPPKQKDLPKKPEKYKISVDNKEYYFKKIDSKKVASCEFVFIENSVKKEDIQYLKFITSILTKLSPIGEGENIFIKDLHKIVAGYHFSFAPYVDKKNNVKARIILQLQYLQKYENKIFIMLSLLLKNINFDKKIIMQNLDKKIETMKNSFAFSGHMMASSRAMSKVSKISYLKELTGGIEYYIFLKNLKKEMEKDFVNVEKKFKEITKNTFIENDIVFAHTSDKKNKNLYKKLELKSKKVKKFLYNFKLTKEHEAVIFDGLDNSFNSIGVALGKTKKSWDMMTALPGFLTYGYLWEKVREEGGAYGSGLQVDSVEGTMNTYSYMDSRIAETYDDYYKVGDYLKTLKLSETQRDGIIAKSLNMFIQPEDQFSEAGKILWWGLKGIDQKRMEKLMKEIKSFQRNDFSEMSIDVKKCLKQGARVTFTNSTKIKKDKKLFDIITIID